MTAPAGSGGAPVADDATPGSQPVDRATVFATPPPSVPKKFILWMLGAIVVLGGGGEAIEHVLDDHGIPSYSVSATTPTAVSSGGSRPLKKTPSLRSFMGSATLSGATAPAFTLTDQLGRSLSLASLRGRVVVLGFTDAACDDICPVLLQEFADAERLLGPSAHDVAFVAVNTDPLDLSVAALERTTNTTAMRAATNWYFVTGPISALDTVWTRYGITIEVGRSSHKVAHTDVLYFIDAQGHERIRVTPFANENRYGVNSLPRSTENEFARGVESYVEQLMGSGNGS